MEFIKLCTLVVLLLTLSLNSLLNQKGIDENVPEKWTKPTENEHVLHDDFWITEDKAKRVHNDSIEL